MCRFLDGYQGAILKKTGTGCSNTPSGTGVQPDPGELGSIVPVTPAWRQSPVSEKPGYPPCCVVPLETDWFCIFEGKIKHSCSANTQDTSWCDRGKNDGLFATRIQQSCCWTCTADAGAQVSVQAVLWFCFPPASVVQPVPGKVFWPQWWCHYLPSYCLFPNSLPAWLTWSLR